MFVEDEVVDILKTFLGSPHSQDPNKGQISFNCPNCDMGGNKGNLEVNYKKNVYSCWSCRQQDDGVRGGNIIWLAWKYGEKTHFADLKKLLPNVSKSYKTPIEFVTYPPEFYNFSEKNKNQRGYDEALNYLLKRKISMEDILEHNIGFCNKGKYWGRVLIPSFDEYKSMNYYVTRDYTGKNKIKYLNPPSYKDLVFNEYYLDYDSPIFLVEGVFDHLVLPNSVPLLGKSISDKLMNNLFTKSNSNIYIALDADAKSDIDQMYMTINFGKLRDRVYKLSLPKDEDISSLRENNDIQDFLNIIKQSIVL